MVWDNTVFSSADFCEETEAQLAQPIPFQVSKQSAQIVIDYLEFDKCTWKSIANSKNLQRRSRRCGTMHASFF